MRGKRRLQKILVMLTVIALSVLVAPFVIPSQQGTAAIYPIPFDSPIIASNNPDATPANYRYYRKMTIPQVAGAGANQVVTIDAYSVAATIEAGSWSVSNRTATWRLPFYVIERSGVNLTDHQFRVEVDTYTLVDLGVYFESSADGTEVEFADHNGNDMYFWLEDELGTPIFNDREVYSPYWVKGNATASTTHTWYLYGNPSWTASSALYDGNNTFDLFDDFQDASYNLEAPWTDDAGVPAEGSGQLQLLCAGACREGITSNLSGISDPARMRIRLYADAAATEITRIGFSNQDIDTNNYWDDDCVYLEGWNGDIRAVTNNGGGVDVDTGVRPLYTNIYDTHEVVWNTTSARYKIYGSRYEKTDAIPTDNMGVRLEYADENWDAALYIDWVFVTQWTGDIETEPVVQVSRVMGDGARSDGSAVVCLNNNVNLLNLDDVIFTSDMTTLYNFTREWLRTDGYWNTEDSSRWARYRVQISGNLSASAQDVYIHYGYSGASYEGNATNTFAWGHDFDDQTLRVTVDTNGGGTCATDIADQYHSTLRLEWPWLLYGNPIRGGGVTDGWDGIGCREFGTTIYGNGTTRLNRGNLDVYFSAFEDDAVGYIGKGISNDGGATIIDHYDGYVLGPNSDTDAPDDYAVGFPYTWHSESEGNTSRPFKMFYTGWEDEGPGARSMCLAESVYGYDYNSGRYSGNPILEAGNFSVSGADTLAMSWMIEASAGYYVAVGEIRDSQPGPVGEWEVVAATAELGDIYNWTVVNSGWPIIADEAWNTDGRANPKIIEVSDGNFILSVNGMPSGDGFNVGYYYTSVAPKSWGNTSFTNINNNPQLYHDGVSGSWKRNGVECSGMSSVSSDIGTTLFPFWYQGFAGRTGLETSQVNPSMGMALFPQTAFLFGQSPDSDDDAWIAGINLTDDAGIANNDPFMFETQVAEHSQKSAASADGRIYFGLYDAISVPNCDTTANFNPGIRLIVQKASAQDATNRHKWCIVAYCSDSQWRYWGGSSWDLTATWWGGEGLAKVKIWGDGTYYYAGVYDAWTGETIVESDGILDHAEAGTPRVAAVSNDRILYAGEPYTNDRYQGGFIDDWFVSKYNASIAVGEPENEVDTGSAFRRNIPIGPLMIF